MLIVKVHNMTKYLNQDLRQNRIFCRYELSLQLKSSEVISSFFLHKYNDQHSIFYVASSQDINDEIHIQSDLQCNKFIADSIYTKQKTSFF